MRTRTCWLIFVIAIIFSLKDTQPAIAMINCKTDVVYSFKDWYQITAKKESPERPIIKQQLEELHARGDLSKEPRDYYTKFSAELKLEPGSATWETVEKQDQWVWDCTPDMANKGLCMEKRHRVQIEKCVSHTESVYRSIKTMRFFLIPDIKTIDWYRDWASQSPVLKLSYPDFFLPVAVTDGGRMVADGGNSLGGLHFYYSLPIGSWYFFPSKLMQKYPTELITNTLDIQNVTNANIDKLIAICDVNTYSNPQISYYGYDTQYGVFSDVDEDPYHCDPPAEEYQGSMVQKIDLTITDYDFDIPGTFYIGITAEIDPAVSPADHISREVISDPNELRLTNFKNSLPDETLFTVWMIVSTPCWAGDNGCEKH